MNGKTKLAIGSIAAALVGTVCFSVAAFADASSNTSAETNPEQALVTKVADNLGLPYDQVLGAFDKAQQELSNEALQQRLVQAVENGTITQAEADEITAWLNDEPDAAANLSLGWLNGLMRPSGNFSGSATSNLSAPPDMGKGSSGIRPSGNFSANMSAPPDMGNMSDMSGGFHGTRPAGNFSANVSTGQGNMTDMGRGFPGMRTSDNSSASGTASMGNMPGGSTLSTEEYIQQAVDNGTITQAQADEITAWINAMPDAMTKLGSLQHNGHMGPSDSEFYTAPF